jgi:hypothetical protein
MNSCAKGQGWDPRQRFWGQNVGAASLTIATDYSKENGFLSKETMIYRERGNAGKAYRKVACHGFPCHGEVSLIHGPSAI